MFKLLLAITFATYCFPSIAQHNLAIFNDLGKLQGTWTMKKASGIITEQWKQKNKNEWVGKSWIIKGNDSSLSETLVISYHNGIINYTSTVAGQNDGKAVSFSLTKVENNTYIFENPQHDFPKRIIYQFVNNDELIAFIDDGMANTKNKITFNYKRKPE